MVTFFRLDMETNHSDYMAKMLAVIIIFISCVISRADTWKADIACQLLLSYQVWQERFLLKLQHRRVSIYLILNNTNKVNRKAYFLCIL